MLMKSILVSFFFLFAFTVFLNGFEFTLRNGQVIKGNFNNREFLITDDKGTEHLIDADELYSVHLKGSRFYLNPENSYSFVIPDGWILNVDAGLGSRLVHLRGPADHGGKMTVMVQDFDRNRSFYDFVTESLKDIEKNEFRLKNKEAVAIEGFDDSVLFDLEISVSGKPLCTQQAAFYRSSDRKNLLLTCVYDPADKEYFRMVFDQFLQSVRSLK